MFLSEFVGCDETIEEISVVQYSGDNGNIPSMATFRKVQMTCPVSIVAAVRRMS